MTASKMVNFRLSQGELDRIDMSARQAGMTRSDWIKNALRSATKIVDKKVVQLDVCAEPLSCVKAEWVGLPTGLRKCLTCGVKVGS